MLALFDQYQPAADRHDELMAGQKLRPHWRYLAESISSLDERKLTERRLELQRLLEEHGVTYNVYGRSNRRARAWALDMLPLPLTSREWRDIEVGMAQRAELLRLILHDIYGAQRLLREGLLPARLVFSHPGFLLPCWNSEARLERQLTIYAADLGRAPDGRFWVTEDRTQAPSGIGYALEARTVLSRVLPSLFRDSNVHPVLPFLRALRRALLQLADNDPDAIGVLTPGPANETWSEQAYLARQLGLPLLEGEDLTVAGGRCWMLSTEGRRQIRVLMRRMDDAFCEPLELNRQSVLGTPGVLQTVRSRHLCFANPLGSGVVENPALMRFLPELCRVLLGEELRLPSVSTWWCGLEGDLQEVEARFDELVLRRMASSPGSEPIAVSHLDRAGRDELLHRVKAQPSDWVAQLRTSQGTAPVLTRRGIESRCLEIRTFAVSEGDSFRVMSGGLARAGASSDSWRVSGQLGGVCKDVWVLSSESQREAQILPQLLPLKPRPQHLTEPHVADNLLWLARYAQRGELLSRLISATLKRLIELSPLPLDPVATVLCRAVSWQTTLYPGFIGPQGEAALADPLPELLRAIQGPESGSLRQDCRALQEAAYPVRDLLTTEIYALLNRLDDDLRRLDSLGPAVRAVEITGLRLSALNGHLLRSLPEGPARYLIETGFALESALGTVRLLRSLLMDAALVHETGPLALDLSNSTGGFADAVDLGGQGGVIYSLLLAQDNPCSVRHQLMILERNLRSSRSKAAADRQHLEAAVADKLVELGLIDLAALLGGSPDKLDQWLHALDDWLRHCAQQVERRYTPDRPAPATQLVRTA